MERNHREDRKGDCGNDVQRILKADPEDILAAVGPSICQDCYEVSEDVIRQFQ